MADGCNRYWRQIGGSRSRALIADNSDRNGISQANCGGKQRASARLRVLIASELAERIKESKKKKKKKDLKKAISGGF